MEKLLFNLAKYVTKPDWFAVICHVHMWKELIDRLYGSDIQTDGHGSIDSTSDKNIYVLWGLLRLHQPVTYI